MKIKLFFLIIMSTFLITSCQSPSSETVNDESPMESNFVEEESPSSTDSPAEEEENSSTSSAPEDFFQPTPDVLSIDNAQSACLEVHQTTVGMINCTGSATDSWDVALNKYYKSAIGSMGPKGSAALKKAQIEWIKFKEAEHQLIMYMVNDFQGTLYSVTTAADILYVTKIRTLELILKNFAIGDETFDEKLYDFVEKEMTNYFGKDTVYSDCEAKDSSNMGMRQCAADAAKHHDKILNDNYNNLMALASSDKQKNVLKQAQRQWIKYRDAELAIYDGIYEDMEGGSMYPTMRAQRNAAVIRQRAIELENYYEFVKLNLE